MTKVYKIKLIENPSLVNPLIASKINEIIGVVNSLALSDKEEYIDGTPVKDWSHVKEEIRKAKQSTSLRDTGKYTVGTKNTWEYTKQSEQSTSLKEAVALVLQENDCESNTLATYKDGVNKILKLLQSHLVKEVETLEPDKYMKMHDKRLDGYTFAKKDIIKIINNITK